MIREYHSPATVAEALTLKAQLADAAVFLAGGTEVNSTAFARTPEHVISLQRLALTDIRTTETELVLGACCTIQQLVDCPDVPEVMRAAGRHVCNRNIRNMATLGGQLGTNRSCSNLLPILVALDAVADVATPGAVFTLPALQYIAEERKEMITRLRIRLSAPARPAAVEKYSRTANYLSILTAAVTLSREGAAIIRPIIAAGGVSRHVTRLEPVERALDGQPVPARAVLERLIAKHVSPITDIRGSAEFKRHLAGVLVAKAILRAYRQSEGQWQ